MKAIIKPPALTRVVRHFKAIKKVKGIERVQTTVGNIKAFEEAHRTKICGVCRKRRPITEYHRRTVGGKRSSRCKFCAARAQRDYRKRRQMTLPIGEPDGLPK